MRILLTGAAGFIGGAVRAKLQASGHDVVGVDALIPQAHPTDAEPTLGVERVDVREMRQLAPLLDRVDVVCHQAAMVGAGVTLTDLPLYAAHNDLGTAVLLAAMAEAGVTKLVLASSMVVYGDGRYRCREHGTRPATSRRLAALEARRFDVGCPDCGAAMQWTLIDEDARLLPRSSYAASKVAQEHFAHAWARQLPGSVVALRYHNVYGPGMPRDTPYSGVAAMFRSAMENGAAPKIFEDGGQMRDFVHVADVARANVSAVERTASLDTDTFTAYNICSGRPISVLEVANLIAQGTPDDVIPEVTGQFRPGDVRHIVASGVTSQ